MTSWSLEAHHRGNRDRQAPGGRRLRRLLFRIGCAFAGPDAAARSCPDARIPLNTSVGGTPIASLTVGGRSGWFLIDSGASLSAVDAYAYGLAAGAAVELSPPFCAPRKSVFRAEDMGSFAAPAGGQRGRIGTDILAGFAVTFSYAGPAPGMTVHAGSLDPAALTAAGFVEIDRPGYYGAAASDRLPGSTGIPVIGLAIGSVAVPAQLDTGFDDARDPGIVQGNAALMAELRQNGVAMHPVPAGSTLGCAGPRPYPRWRIELDRARPGTGRRNACKNLSGAASRDQGRCRLRRDRRLFEAIRADRRLVARALANDDP